MSAVGITVPDMDTGVILCAAELEAPSLRLTARRILETEARRFGISLDVGDVLLRRAEGGPELHVVAAAEELLVHLVAAGENTQADDSALLVLARAGAQLLVSAIELDGACDAAR